MTILGQAGLLLGTREFEEISHLGGFFGYEMPSRSGQPYNIYSNLGAGYWFEKEREAPFIRVECGIRFNLFEPLYVGIGLDEYLLMRKDNNRLHTISMSLGLKF